MNSSVVLGAILVLLASAEMGAAYYFRAGSRRVGVGLFIGAPVTLMPGVLFLIQHANFAVGLIIAVVAQVAALVSLVLLSRQPDGNPTSGLGDSPATPHTYGTPR